MFTVRRNLAPEKIQTITKTETVEIQAYSEDTLLEVKDVPVALVYAMIEQ